MWLLVVVFLNLQEPYVEKMEIKKTFQNKKGCVEFVNKFWASLEKQEIQPDLSVNLGCVYLDRTNA